MSSQKEVFKKLQEDQIDETANSVFPWLLSAHKLLYSAESVDHASDTNNALKNLSNVSRMLVGMAIECYLKAFYIASGHVIKRDKNNKLETHGSHNLKAMAMKFNFKTSEKERSVLHNLSMYIRVKGRYPVPLQLKDMQVEDNFKHKGFIDYGLFWEADYDDICKKMIQRLEEEIKQLRKK